MVSVKTARQALEVEIAKRRREKPDLLTAKHDTSTRRLLRNRKLIYTPSFVNMHRGVPYLSLIPSSEHAMRGRHPGSSVLGPTADKVPTTKFNSYLPASLLRDQYLLKCGFNSRRGLVCHFQNTTKMTIYHTFYSHNRQLWPFIGNITILFQNSYKYIVLSILIGYRTQVIKIRGLERG